MVRKVDWVISYNPGEINPDYIADRNLYAAILGRAFFDLSPIAPSESRKSALKWFEVSLEEELSPTVTFTFIKELLNLGDYELNIIKDAIKEAKEYENFRLNTKFLNRIKLIETWYSIYPRRKRIRVRGYGG